MNRLIFFGEESLRRSINEFILHYHTERNHQGVENRLLTPLTSVHSANDPVHSRERLGGLLNYCHREALKLVYCIFAPYGVLVFHTPSLSYKRERTVLLSNTAR